jgi:hypothetical protein
MASRRAFGTRVTIYDTSQPTPGLALGRRFGPPELGDGHHVPQPRNEKTGSAGVGLYVSGFLLFQQGGAGDFQGSFQIRNPPAIR